MAHDFGDWKIQINVWIMDGRLLAVTSHHGRGEGALLGLFYNSTNSIHKGSSNYLPKAQSPNTILIGS